MDDADKKPYCQVIGQILLIDAEITDGEHEFLEALMIRLQLTEPMKEAVVESLCVNTPVVEIIADLSSAAREGLLGDARQAASVDGGAGTRETELLKQIEAALAPT